MKNKIKILFICFATTILASCGSSEAQKNLREEVEKAKVNFPIHISEGITIDSIDYTSDMVTYYTNVTGDLIQLKTLREESDAIDRLIYEALKNSDSPEIREQLEMCKKADAKIVFVFSNPAGDTFDITIDPKEFENTVDTTALPSSDTDNND